MKADSTELPEVILFSPTVISDGRGVFFEAWRQERYAAVTAGLTFVQDSVSVSRRGVLRGLHLQHPHAQGKLVSVLRGAAFDVAVDVRRESPTFGHHVAVTLDAENRRQLWIPPGFAHGFQALVDDVIFHYKCTDTYRPDCEITVRWNDPDIGIAWPIAEPSLSARDGGAPSLGEVLSRLPQWEAPISA